LAEFLKFARRRAAISSGATTRTKRATICARDKDLQPWMKREMFDADSAAFFNERMPLSVLREAALNEQLPEHLKKF
jgi:hypothetical protein